MRLLFFVFALTVCSAANAQQAYKCVILDYVQIQDDGTFGEPDLPPEIGADFVVDRGTGRMSGALNNHNWPPSQVLDMGSSEQAYKAITVTESYVSVTFLYVEEFAESRQKPFFFVGGLSGQTISSGLCEDY